ncbi:flagellar export chaperone FliS [Paenibacillus alkaliterrae]|uniref:flagellar export chaperone FliS n=1 Tax=Paenibacillus alkaliterrae TaxID=320909 RepID=UPI001F2E094D|nr:flagellar export chaperone FliS [Paenibacillus alkaliterrae]MCF2941403.1 flagellar export chaperone FliS [Paenibacillus alkaliterrae]
MIQSQVQRNKYLETTIQTATPAQLLIMLCDGAIRFSRLAIEAINNNELQIVNTNLIKVQNIISEFIITIDRSSSVAEQLLKLYEYFNYRLIEANMKKSIEPIQEVLGYLVEMKETWIQANKLVNSSSAVSGIAHG